MPFILWFLVVLGTLVGLMSALVCYAACAVGGMADEQSEHSNTARPGGNTSVAANSDPVRATPGARTTQPFRVVR